MGIIVPITNSKKISLKNIDAFLVEVESSKPAIVVNIKVNLLTYGNLQLNYRHNSQDKEVTYTFPEHQEQISIATLIPSCCEGLYLFRDGSIVIDYCEEGVDLALKSSGTIINTSDFSGVRLHLDAKRLILKHNISIKRSCKLVYKEALDNYAILDVGATLDCRGSTKAELNNYGAIKVQGKGYFNFATKEPLARVFNYGLLYAEQGLCLKARGLANHNSILSTANIIFSIKKMVNHGIILSNNSISLIYQKYVINGDYGVIASNEELRIGRISDTVDSNLSTESKKSEPEISSLDETIDNIAENFKGQDILIKAPTAKTVSVINQGKILALTKIYIGNSEAIVTNKTTGLLQAPHIDILGTILVNDGKILGKQKFEITLVSSDGRFYNNNTGQVETKRINCNPIKLINMGYIHAQQAINGVLHSLDNQTQGQILVDAKMRLMAVEKITNDCLIQSTEELALDSKSIVVGESGQIIAKKLTTFSQNLANHGELIAEENAEIVAQHLENFAPGKIITAKELAIIIEEKLSNHGLLQGKIANFNSKEANNYSSGVLDFTELTWEAGNLTNAGYIYTTQATKLSVVANLEQTSTAQITSNASYVDLHSASLQLSGQVDAAKTVNLQGIDIEVNQDAIISGHEKVTFIGNNITNEGIIVAQQELNLHAYNKLQQTSTSQIVAPEIFVKALTLENAGKILASKSASLDTNTLSNLYQAIIASASQITINSSDLTNEGVIQAYDELRLILTNCLANLVAGEIQSLHNLLIEAGCKLINAGLINAETKALIKVSEALENYASGIMKATEFNLNVGWHIDNWGQLLGTNQLALEVSGIIVNYQSGKISSNEAIDLISFSLTNDAEIKSNKLKLFITNTLHNHQTGKLHTTQALIVGAKLVVNSGEMLSTNHMLIESIEVLTNLQTGSIAAANGLTTIAEMLIENHGQLTANQLKLQASLLLLEGNIVSEELDLTAKHITTKGKINSQTINLTADLIQLDGEMDVANLTVEAKNYLQLLGRGAINCHDAAKLVTKAGFVNLGKILSHNELTIIANELFHDVGAELDSRHELYLQAVNLYLDGDLNASGNFFVIAANNFAYKTATLKADGTLHLTLDDDSFIVHDIKTPGSLHIKFLAKDGTWYNEQQLTAGRDITIDIPGFIFINGRTSEDALIHAQETLQIKAKQIEVDKGTLLANKLDLHSKYNIIVTENGTIAGVNGNLTAIDSIEQYGKIEFLKNLAMMAKKAYGHQGSTTFVAGDLEVEVDQWILEGLTKVDGELSAKVIDFHLKQYANTLQVPVIYNGYVGQVIVSIQQANPQTGLLQANKITLSCEKFTQLGGQIKSGNGGTYIEIKGDAFLEGLRTTNIWQGAISARGRNYAIVPVFVPAKIESEGDLIVIADGKLVGASIELKAVGVKEIIAQNGINITEKHEHYDPPEYIQPKKKKGFLRGLLSIAVSAFASCFVGPAACGLMGIANTTTLAITSAAIGGAVGAALNGGKIKDIFKSAVIGAITAGAMDKLKIKLPSKAQDVTVKATQNAIRTTAATNNILKYGLQTGVKAVVNGRGNLDLISLISSGIAGFSGATIDDQLHKNLLESTIKTGATTAIHGGKLAHNFMNSTAEVIGSHLGEQMGNEFASKIEEQRLKMEIKKQETQYKLNLSKKSLIIEKAENNLILPANPEKEQVITQSKLLQAILLQEDQAALINKIENRIKLFAIQQAQHGKLINVTEHIQNIATQINAMDRNQIKDLNKNLDHAISLQNTVVQLEVKPIVLPLALPIATQLMLRVALPSLAAYFAGKAMINTYDVYQKSKDHLGFPVDSNNQTIFTTSTEYELSQDQSSSSNTDLLQKSGGLFNVNIFQPQEDTQNIITRLIFLMNGLYVTQKTSVRKTVELDLTLPKTFTSVRTVNNANKETASSDYLSNVLANSIPQVATNNSVMNSPTAVLPLFNNQQQIFRYGAGTRLGIAGILADKAIIESAQQFKHDQEQLPSKYIFVPEEPISSTSELPIHTVEPLITTFPINENKVTILAGPVIEIKKPIIFSGGLDDKDKQFLDSLTVMENRKKPTENSIRVHAPNPDHGHIPAPEKFKKKNGTLPGFPESKFVGINNDKRYKWVLKDKTFATWDKRHGAVDLFNKTGKIHLGKYDPYTGKKLKDPKPERSSKP